MNNLLSYYGLVDATISASEKDLPVQVFILQTYTLLVPFKGFPVFEIRKNLDLGKILGVTKIFLKSRFVCMMKEV